MKKRTSLLDVLVVVTPQGSIEGKIEDCLIDLAQKKILGWSFRKDGFFSPQQFILSEDSVLGLDVILSSKVVEPPVELNEWICWGVDLLKNQVLNRKGEEISVVKDIVVDREGKELIGLETDKGLLIEAQDPVVSIRKTIVVLPNDFSMKKMPQQNTSWWGRFWGRE